MPREASAAIREALIAAVEPFPAATVALSGGTDSASVLAAHLALGRKPDCYTFQLLPGESLDLKIARSMCETFGLKLHVAQIGRAQDRLLADLRRLLPYASRYLGEAYGAKEGRLVKVPVQCLQPMSYVLDLGLEHGVGVMMTGFCADTYYGNSRSMSVMLREEGLAAWDAYRRKYLVHPVNADLLVQAYFRDNGIDLFDAWAAPCVQDVMFRLGPKELHTKVPKLVALRAFPEFWKRGKWVRENQSLQVVGGIREWHDTLLASPINKRAHRVIVSLYADILKEIENGDVSVADQLDIRDA
jgi:hypothetical protein